MRNIKLILEYEGTGYLGWQRQPQGMTVQQALEEALERITGAKTTVVGAGRTDAGVHARGQTANFRTESDLPVERLRGALNALLPRDIVVLKAEEVPQDFNARFSARSKLYYYTVRNGRTRPALSRDFCWHVRWPLEILPMHQAAAHLLGRHDFAAFQSAGADTSTTVRTVFRADWTRSFDTLTFAIEADGFLYNMVRAIVGTLAAVGRGKITPDEFAEIVNAKDRARAGRTAPAQGLCLMRVRY